MTSIQPASHNNAERHDFCDGHGQVSKSEIKCFPQSNPFVFARCIAKVAADDEEEGVDEKIEFPRHAVIL
jgi:hypothetical protein